MTVNTRLQENPVLQRFPQGQREWVQFINELAKWVRYIVKFGDGTITTSGGTTVSGLDEIAGSVHLGDGSIKTSGGTQIDGLTQMPGTVVGQSALNTISVFNRSSTQSASPLTAADVGSDVTITIASHNVVFDATTLAYNSGSITGLGFSTKYYVYADDPTKAGGAVTYVSTTTKTDVTANVGRYYVGDVTTPADGGGDTGGNPGGGGGGFDP